MFVFLNKSNQIFGVFGTIKKGEKALIEKGLNSDDYAKIECNLNDPILMPTEQIPNIESCNEENSVFEFTANEIQTSSGLLSKHNDQTFLVKVFLI